MNSPQEQHYPHPHPHPHHQLQQELCTTSKEAETSPSSQQRLSEGRGFESRLSRPVEGTFPLSPPPPYHEAIRSLFDVNAEQSWVITDQDLALYMGDEPDGAPRVWPCPGDLYPRAEPQDIPQTFLENDIVHVNNVEDTIVSPTGLGQSVSLAVPYPSRPHSNPVEVPCCSLALAGHGYGGEFSLYTPHLDTAPPSAGDLTPALPPPLTPRPRSTVSVLSDREYEDIGAGVFFENHMDEGSTGDMDFGGYVQNQLMTMEESQSVLGEEGERAERKPEETLRAGLGESPGDLAQSPGDLAQETDWLEEKRRLLQDMTVTTTDEELLACARRMVETDDHSLLTKMMLKTKLQLTYVSRGQSVPDVTAFPAKQHRQQLRPEEEEKVDRRKRNGRVSAKTYRDKMKRLKGAKEQELEDLQERNQDLKHQVQSLQDQIASLRHRALSKHLLSPTTSATTSTASTTTSTASTTTSGTMVPGSSPPPSSDAGSPLSLWPGGSSPGLCGDVSRHLDVATFPLTPPPR